jgi:hypothetical protein
MASGSAAMLMDSSRARGGTAFLDFTYSCQASAEHFQQCAEFLPLRNGGLGPLAVTVLPIPLAGRPAATACAAPFVLDYGPTERGGMQAAVSRNYQLASVDSMLHSRSAGTATRLD